MPEGGELYAGLDVQVAAVDRTARDNRASISRIGERTGKLETAQAISDVRYEEMKEDIAALTDTVRWLTRGAWAVSGTFLILAATIAAAIAGGN